MKKNFKRFAFSASAALCFACLVSGYSVTLIRLRVADGRYRIDMTDSVPRRTLIWPVPEKCVSSVTFAPLPVAP